MSGRAVRLALVSLRPLKLPARLARPFRSDAGLVGIACLLAIALLLLLPHEMSPDGWYALLGGDVVVHRGLPSHDWLTVWGHGRRWVDQQWLAQLAYYGLYALGGLRLALLANAAVVVASFALAVVAARTRGGSAAATLGVGALGAVAIGAGSAVLRPQTLVLPLFVVLVRLLVADARRPSPRVFLAAPVLVLWANLHGSVTLAALLVLVRLAVSLFEGSRPVWQRVGLVALGLLAPFASPYAAHLAGYYRAILLNHELARYVPDWLPTRLTVATLAFYVLAGLTLFSLGRGARLLTLFERASLVVLLLLAIEATRGVTWFALFAVMTVPVALRGTRIDRYEMASPLLRRAALVALAAVAVCLAAVAAQPSSWFGRGYPAAAAAAAREAAGGRQRVFSNAQFADWLLFVEPALRGRVAYDARFEVLPHGRVADAAAISIDRWDARRLLDGYDVLVLQPAEDELRNDLLRSGMWKRLPTHSRVIVLRRVAGRS